MKCKCVRCERTCYASDKTTKYGVSCCTDCAGEIVSLLHETIQCAILKSHKNMHIEECLSTKPSHMVFTTQVRLPNTGDNGSHLMECKVEYWNKGYTEFPTIQVTDSKTPSNIAIRHPIRGNMNSVRACVRICMTMVIDNSAHAGFNIIK